MTEPGARIEERPSLPDTLVVQARYPGVRPEVLFNYWTEPDLITQWWPAEAEIDATEGGRYCLSWPKMNWYLRGTYERFDPPRALAFTWSWDHEPDVTPTHVTLIFEPYENDGTLLTVTHGPYSETPEGLEQRRGNLEGWTHFLSKLYELDIPASPS